MVFTGFNIEYPSYSVVTPQTGDQYDVRCLTVADVNELKHSSLTPAKSITITNDIIWKAIKNKPDNIKSYKDFLHNTTLADRAALVYGIYHSTFGDDREAGVVCEECGTTDSRKFNLNDMFSINPYPSKKMKDSVKVIDAVSNKPKPEPVPYNKSEINYVEDEDGEVVETHITSTVDNASKKESKEKEVDKVNEDDILQKKVVIDLPVSKVKVYLIQPTLADEEKLVSSVPFTNYAHVEFMLETLSIEKFIHTVNGVENTITNREEILDGYNSLPATEKNIIYEEFEKAFGQYNISMEAKWECNKCKAENVYMMSIVTEFFRMAQAL